MIPDERMLPEYPWQVWLVGWLAIFKGVVWIAISPNLPEPILNMLGAKYLLCMVPFVVFGIGVWNMKKWAVWGVLLLSVIDLIFMIVLYPESVSFMEVKGLGMLSTIITICLMIANGPFGNVVVLALGPNLVMATGSEKNKKLIKGKTI